MSVNDQNQLRIMSGTAASPVLRNVLTEVVGMMAKVVDWTHVQTSGSAACRYNTVTGTRVYEVRYQEGDLANLVHELTHVAVNEAYQLDFVNYPNTTAQNVPARRYDDRGHCINEFDRQTKFMLQTKNLQTGTTLQTLKQWANLSELSAERKKQVMDKFDYGIMNPHKEYDTVINQVLMWLTAWGYPLPGPFVLKPVVNALFEETEKAVKKAYEMRGRGNV